jgi:hypothetical protein
MVLTGAIDWLRAIILFVTQILGSFLASGLAYGLFPEPFGVNTVLPNGISVAQGFFIDTLLTLELVFAVCLHPSLFGSTDTTEDTHAREREAQGDFYSSHRNRPHPLHRRIDRRILYRRLAQSSQIVWTGRDNREFHVRSLDLLARAGVWVDPCGWFI